MRFIKIFLSLSLVWVVFSTYAQMRVEIELKGSSDVFVLLPTGPYGLLVCTESDSNVRDAVAYNVIKYDTNLRSVWTRTILAGRRQALKNHYYDASAQKLYLLMSYQKRMFSNGGFNVYEVDINSGNTRVISSSFPNRILLRSFYAINGCVYMGGLALPPARDAYLKQAYTMLLMYIPSIFGSMRFKTDAFLLKADFNTMNTQRIPFNFKGSSGIYNVSGSPDSNIVDVFTMCRKRKSSSFAIHHFNTNGNESDVTRLNIDDKYDITSGKLLRINAQKKILLGTYNKRSKKYKHSYFETDLLSTVTSAGLYYAEIDGDSLKYMNIYPFSRFSNFYSYLTFKGQTRINRKINRREARGKEIDFRYSMLIHDLISYENGYIMIAEAYYPEYETRCQTMYYGNGSSSQQCYTVFVGYRFTHTIIAGFDTNGVLKWDNSFEMMDVLTYELKPKVKHLIEDGELVLVYSYGGELKTKVIAEDKVLETKTNVSIETGRKDDKVKQELGSGIEYWYNNYFVAYGYQKIKTTTPGVRSTRKVFYFSKIAYE